MLYDRIQRERQHIQQQLDSLQTQIKKSPEGTFVCCHDKNHCKWYRSDGHHKVYIPKSNRSLAEQLAIKKYLSCLAEDLTHDARALDLYLNYCSEHSAKKATHLAELPGYQELLAPYLNPHSQELSDWLNAPYEQNPSHPEQLIHKTSSDIAVRSKSESLIAISLQTNQIPFRYECALPLDNATIYPDFTIRHPRTGKLFYWEHFGRMDDPTYCKNAFSKLHLYASQGIIPTIQLITTYETQENPLTSEMIQNMIEQYLG